MDEYHHPVFFECRRLQPDEERKVRTYFQIKRKSGGGACGPLTLMEDNIYKIAFRRQEDQQAVLQKSQHVVQLADERLVFSVSHDSTSDNPPAGGSTTPTTPPPLESEERPTGAPSQSFLIKLAAFMAGAGMGAVFAEKKLVGFVFSSLKKLAESIEGLKVLGGLVGIYIAAAANGAAKQAAEAAAKEAVKEAAKELMKEAGKEAGKELTKEAVKKLAEEAAKEAAAVAAKEAAAEAATVAASRAVQAGKIALVVAGIIALLTAIVGGAIGGQIGADAAKEAKTFSEAISMATKAVYARGDGIFD